MARKERTGFLFYELPVGREDLRGLELAMTVTNSGTQESISVVTSLPNASFKGPKQVKASDDKEGTAVAGGEK